MKASILHQASSFLLSATLVGGMTFFVAGCQKQDVQFYRVAKGEADNQEHSAGPAAEGASQDPRIQWTMPSGWKAQPPSQMKLGSFLVLGNDGHKAEISVVALPGQAGGELENVNRWRRQISLAPIDDAGLKSTEIKIGGTASKLYELGGGSESKLKTIAAWASVDGTSWFFKISGDDDTVTAQRALFEQFLQSIAFTGAAATSPEPSVSDASSAPPAAHGEAPATLPAGHPDLSGPQWTPPKEWETKTGSSMRVGSFAYTDKSGSVDIAITVFPGDVGGNLANVNRWRSQVGLGAVAEDQLSGMLTPIELDGGQGNLVDLTGESPESSKPMKMVAVMYKKNGQTWFFKMLGDPATVTSQKAAFVKFVQSSHLPNG